MDKTVILYNVIDNLYNKYLSLVYRYKYRMYSIKDLTVNKTFKNIHQNQRCFILGNGPSLRNQKLEYLKDEIVFTVNQASRYSEYQKVNSNYHIIADPIFFELDNLKQEDIEVIDYIKKINCDNCKPKCFFPLKAKPFLEANNLIEILDIYYFVDGLKFTEDYKSQPDFTKLIPGFCTVVHYAIWLAIYMGFAEIYLLGCDMTGYKNIELRMSQTHSSDQYSYNLTELEKKRIIQDHKVQSNENMFLGFGKMFKDYRIINDFCGKINSRLYNLTYGGILDNVMRKDYDEIINVNNKL